MKKNYISIPLIFEGEKTKEMLLKRLEQLGTGLRFDDDIWFCDKIKNNQGTANSNYTIYFTVTPEKYKKLLKWYTLVRKEKNQVSTLVRKIGRINYFLKYLKEYCFLPEIERVDGKIINHFELYLKEQGLKKSYHEGIWSDAKDFFEFLLVWECNINRVPFGKYNPFSRKAKDYKIDGKYIPEYVCKQLDSIFQGEGISLHIKLAYWLMRAIPSRVSEITGMPLESLKPSYDDKMVLFTPTTKQEGDIGEPVIRAIYLNPKGDFEKFLIELIEKQKEDAKKLQDKIKDKEKNYLFTITNKHVRLGKPYILNDDGIENAFKKICMEYEVKDENGKLFSLSSHMLRHNAITDRIDSGFSFIEIRDMTYHKGNSMLWNAYYHASKEKMIEKQKEVIRNSKYIDIEKPVYFRGRVFNVDKSVEERILKNPRAYRLSDGENDIGLCSDITGCKSKMFECLDCEYFVSNAEQLDYFRSQVQIWESKVKMFRTQKQALEKAEYNLKLHKKIVERIEKQIEINNEEVKND